MYRRTHTVYCISVVLSHCNNYLVSHIPLLYSPQPHTNLLTHTHKATCSPDVHPIVFCSSKSLLSLRGFGPTLTFKLPPRGHTPPSVPGLTFIPYLIAVSGDWVRDPRGGAEGAARASHRHEDPPRLPVRVPPGRVQAPGGGETAHQDPRPDLQGEAGEESQVSPHREGGGQADGQVHGGAAEGHQGQERVPALHGRGQLVHPQIFHGRSVGPD